MAGEFQSRWSCGNAADVPPLAGVLIHYSHLLFDISTVVGKLISVATANSSFATAAIKLMCVWSVVCPEDFEPSRGDNRAAATAAVRCVACDACVACDIWCASLVTCCVSRVIICIAGSSAAWRLV